MSSVVGGLLCCVLCLVSCVLCVVCSLSRFVCRVSCVLCRMSCVVCIFCVRPLPNVVRRFSSSVSSRLPFVVHRVSCVDCVLIYAVRMCAVCCVLPEERLVHGTKKADSQKHCSTET